MKQNTTIIYRKVLHDYKCVFIHIPKTAGDSITDTLSKLPHKGHIDTSTIAFPKHAKAIEIKTAIGDKLWNDYFTFSFVRNPWDLMVSSYHWWIQKAERWDIFHEDVQCIKQMNTFAEFMRSAYGMEMINEHKGNIIDWISEKGEIITKFVGRFETLDNDWNLVCKHIGIICTKLPHINRGLRNHYRHYYDEDSKQIIYRRFSKEIEFFGYEF